MQLRDDQSVRQLIAMARAEDLGDGDLSSTLLPNGEVASTFSVLVKSAGVVAGCEIAATILEAYNESLSITWEPGVVDGLAIKEVPKSIATIRGPLATVLSAERVLLNFLQRLSGVATITRRYVDAIAGTSAAIYDTRKTTPGWRKLEKYAVRCGGGRNHREGLFDAVLIKDNHLAGVPVRQLASFVFELLNQLSATGKKPSFVEIEADSLDQVEALLSVVGIDIILLDNFDVDRLREAVEMRDSFGLRGKVELEASGGVNLTTVRAIAETGVERISVGAITHSATALDISLERI